MSSPVHLTDLTLRAFADRLAERSPTPGGGSVAAYLVAAGSALAAMAFRFTSGAKFAGVEAAMARRVEDLERLRARGLELVDVDARAYDAVTAAFKLPKSTETEKALRSEAIQSALRGALEVPAETMQRAVEALRLAAAGIGDANPNLASDCLSGAWCLAGAAEAALLNVRINAASIADATWAEKRLAACRALADEAQKLLADAKAAVARHLPK